MYQQEDKGLGWIIAPELPQTFDPSHHIKTFDGLLASSSYGDAEDKALYMLSSLAVSPQQKEAIERATVGQTKNALWMAYRRKRITASNFGLVLAAVKRNSYPPSLFKTLLGHYNLKQGAHACDWGIVHEQKAKEEYMKRTGVTFQESGVFLSDSGLLGGSPDGLVSDDCIIEVTGEGCDSIGGHTNQSLKCGTSFVMTVQMTLGVQTFCVGHSYFSTV
uniref:YqaJ viral recombinase domain-containing protein n=1 Tax=Knipowitschia caucasica TaxID=637954 RepID=A0AAV2J6V3_KNICA